MRLSYASTFQTEPSKKGDTFPRKGSDDRNLALLEFFAKNEMSRLENGKIFLLARFAGG